MDREAIINEFRALVLLQGDGAEVYELLDGDLFAHSHIDPCKGENIVATFDAWKGSREGYCVKEGEKALFFDGDNAFFHWSQVEESPAAFDEAELYPLYTRHDFY